MKFHFAAITLLGLADRTMSRYSNEKTKKKEQEQCTVQDASDYTQPDGSVLGCIKGATINNRHSSSKKSSKSSGIFDSYNKMTDSSTDDCGTLRILPVNQECMKDDIPLVITKPRPPPTPCTCTSTEYVASPVLRSYLDHTLLATERSCTLATASDETEKTAITDYLTNNPYMGPEGPGRVLLIGLRRPIDAQLNNQGHGLANDPTEGSPDGPWMWDDGCTPYTFNPFFNGNRGDEPNNLFSNELIGAVSFVEQDPFEIGDIVDVGDSGYPALFECCV